MPGSAGDEAAFSTARGPGRTAAEAASAKPAPHKDGIDGVQTRVLQGVHAVVGPLGRERPHVVEVVLQINVLVVRAALGAVDTALLGVRAPEPAGSGT